MQIYIPTPNCTPDEAAAVIAYYMSPSVIIEAMTHTTDQLAFSIFHTALNLQGYDGPRPPWATLNRAHLTIVE